MPACPICNTPYTQNPSTEVCSNCGWFLYLNRQLDVPTFEKLKDWGSKLYLKSSQPAILQESPPPGVQLPHVPGMGITSSVNLQNEIEKMIDDRQIIGKAEIEKMIDDRLSHYDQKFEDLEDQIREIGIESKEVDAKIDTKITENTGALKGSLNDITSRLEAVEKIKIETALEGINTKVSNLEGTIVKTNDIQQIKLDLEKYISFKLQGTSISTNTFTSTPRSGSSTMPPTIAQPTSNNAHESQTNRAAFNLVEEYNKTSDRIPESITNKATYVRMDRDQLASRRDVNYPPVLSAKPSGNFLVVVIADTSYLVPNKKVYFDEYAYKTALALYDCQGYSDHYTRMELIRPAVVAKTADNEWTLAYKGILKFI
jgi:hypothetical protein